MPEGDTVLRTARRLDRALSGRLLLESDFRVPALATSDLTGATVTSTRARGKHLLTRIQRSQDAWTLHTHLRMEGLWQVLEPGGRWLRPADQARVLLRVPTVTAIGFALGMVQLVSPNAEADVVGHLGPDLLGPDWDPAEAVRRLAEHPHRSLAESLLDQRCLAGIGNVYASELAFIVGVAPGAPVAAVRDLHRLVALAHRVLLANASRATRCTTGDLRRGRNYWVYGRAGQPCRRCDTTIRRTELGPPGRERPAYWCPRCQQL